MSPCTKYNLTQLFRGVGTEQVFEVHRALVRRVMGVRSLNRQTSDGGADLHWGGKFPHRAYCRDTFYEYTE